MKQCLGVVVFIVSLGFCACPGRVLAQSLDSGTSQRGTNSVAVRILKDPALIASCWLLERDPTHPEGPPRWRQVPSREPGDSIPLNRPVTGIVTDRAPAVIRSGDQLTIEEDSKLVEARLQAVALESAGPGEILAVRLRSTGKIIRAVAVAPGRGVFAQESEERP
jgi:hypothetical protein